MNMNTYFVNYFNNKTAHIEIPAKLNGLEMGTDVVVDVIREKIAQTECTIVPLVRINYVEEVTNLGNYFCYNRIWSL